jgi:benzylsuccinate CoA-transferase BbsF subunit
MAVYAILAALRHRERTGEGQFIDLSQWECTVGLVGGPFLDYVMNGRVQGPMGNADPAMAPHGVFPCVGEDRWIAIAVKTDVQWQALCLAAGQPALAHDARFADAFRRLRNAEPLHQLISAWTREHDRWDLALALQAKGVPAFPVFSDKDAFEDRHYWDRQAWVKARHPVVGDKTVFGLAWKLSRTPGTMERPTPAVGQDNVPVFCEMLGMAPRELEELVAMKVVH